MVLKESKIIQLLIDHSFIFFLWNLKIHVKTLKCCDIASENFVENNEHIFGHMLGEMHL